MTESSQEIETPENLRQWPRLVASRVFLISGGLYCIWMLVDLTGLVFAMGPLGLVFVLTALPGRGILTIATFAAAKTVREGRYLGASIALAVYMFWVNAIFAIVTSNARGPQALSVVIFADYSLAVILTLLALTAMWCTIAAYRDVRKAETTAPPEPTPEMNAAPEDNPDRENIDANDE
ncbi:MAG: hypothetical protein GY794_06485 [bacterium]|nr:hypothetical protein [bacterium]